MASRTHLHQGLALSWLCLRIVRLVEVTILIYWDALCSRYLLPPGHQHLESTKIWQIWSYQIPEMLRPFGGLTGEQQRLRVDVRAGVKSLFDVLEHDGEEFQHKVTTAAKALVRWAFHEKDCQQWQAVMLMLIPPACCVTNKFECCPTWGCTVVVDLNTLVTKKPKSEARGWVRIPVPN